MIDYIIEGVCLLLCVFHLIHNHLSNRRLSKKIDNVCGICGAPVSDDEVHKCNLTSSQIEALYNFIISLKSDGGDKNAK